MRDPLLLTYSVSHEPVTRGPLLYDISSGLQPMSIRDQMFRGYILVKRALAKQLIKPNQELPILVIGGGVAGVIASLTAVENNVPVTLVEQRMFFSMQVSAKHRIICPTQYDWPALHWKHGVYPWTGARMPFSWHQKPASEVVGEWTSKLNRTAERKPKLLSLMERTKFLSHTIDTSRAVVYATLQRLPTKEVPKPEAFPEGPFSIAIACGGAGSERTWVPNENPKYRGYPFWSRDPYGKPNLRLPKKIKPSVLISGGGDGALQDYLRILRPKTAREKYEKTPGQIYQTLPTRIQTMVEDTIRNIEDSAMRSFLWGDTGELDHPILEDVHRQYRGLVNRVLTGHKSSGIVRRRIGRLIDGTLSTLSLKFVHPCNHFWSCYPLNRFLVLLFSEYIKIEHTISTMEPDTKLLEVSGVDHSCDLERPYKCHGKPHEVKVADATCSDYDSEKNERILPGGPFNALIIRHGIKRSGFPFKQGPAANPYRQVIPYSSAW